MERKRINSSKIRAVGYDPKNQMLEVEFSDGKVLAYKGVSTEIHRGLMTSPSPVSYWEDKIDEAFSSQRLR